MNPNDMQQPPIDPNGGDVTGSVSYSVRQWQPVREVTANDLDRLASENVPPNMTPESFALMEPTKRHEMVLDLVYPGGWRLTEIPGKPGTLMLEKLPA